MLKLWMSSLPLVVATASCVPPEAGLVPQTGLQLAQLTEIERADAARVEAAEPEQSQAAPMQAAVPEEAVLVGPGARPFQAASSPDDLARSLECLTAAVYYEARSERDEGQRAVAQVVLNRVRHPAFPSSVCGVVYQGSQRRTGCQFSFTCDGSLARRIEPYAWRRARAVAEDALAGAVYEPVGLATHYHTTAILPYWASSLRRAVTVGSHIFYRWRGEWGRAPAFDQAYAGGEPGTRRTMLAAAPVAKAEEERPLAAELPEGLTRVGGWRHIKVAEALPSRIQQPAPVQAVAAVTVEAPPTVGGVRIHRGSSPVLADAPSQAPAAPIS